jgi:hypothetical protein
MLILLTVAVSAYLAGGKLGWVLTSKGLPHPKESISCTIATATNKVRESLDVFCLGAAAIIRLMLKAGSIGCQLAAVQTAMLT